MVGYILAINNFYFKSSIIVILNAFMGIPPVVVGLIVYFLFAREGPFGILQILYTPYAMIIAQSIIIFPIVSSLSYEIFSLNWKQYRDHFRAFNIPLARYFINNFSTKLFYYFNCFVVCIWQSYIQRLEL